MSDNSGTCHECGLGQGAHFFYCSRVQYVDVLYVPPLAAEIDRLRAVNAELVAAMLLAQEKLSFYRGEYLGGPHIKTVNDAITAALAKAKQ